MLLCDLTLTQTIYGDTYTDTFKLGIDTNWSTQFYDRVRIFSHRTTCSEKLLKEFYHSIKELSYCDTSALLDVVEESKSYTISNIHFNIDDLQRFNRMLTSSNPLKDNYELIESYLSREIAKLYEGTYQPLWNDLDNLEATQLTDLIAYCEYLDYSGLYEMATYTNENF